MIRIISEVVHDPTESIKNPHIPALTSRENRQRERKIGTAAANDFFGGVRDEFQCLSLLSD
jgi:hypothetical protein